MEDVSETPARTRMVELCIQREADSLAGQDVQLRPVGDGDFNFSEGNGSWWAEQRIDRIGKFPWVAAKMSWVRAARGVAILDQIGSAEAVKVLEQMAAGHPAAFPTKAAKESLKRLKKPVGP